MGKEGKKIKPGMRQSTVITRLYGPLIAELRMLTIYTTCMQHKHRYVCSSTPWKATHRSGPVGHEKQYCSSK